MDSKRKEELFVRFCAQMGGPLEAARMLGVPGEEALALAAKPRVRTKIAQLEKALEEDARGDAVRTLLRLAKHNCIDGVKLAVRGENMSAQELEALDLAGVASFKYAPGGGCEVKFFDPYRATELLLEISAEQKNSAEDFCKALRDSAQAMEN